MSNDKYIHEFVVAVNETVADCEKLMLHLNNHCGVAPEDVSIGHVYNVRHVNALINEAKTFLGMRED